MIKLIKNNYKILIPLIIFMIISSLSIYTSEIYTGSNEKLYLKQLLWYIIGFIIILIINKIKNKNIYKHAFIFYIILNLLLLILLFIGEPINGSKCWFQIFGISIQPSEFMKIILIINYSLLASNSLHKNTSKKEELLLLFKLFLIFIIPTILVFLEPDTGIILIFLTSLLTILIISPLNKKWLIAILTIGIVFILLFTYIYLYQKNLFIKIFGDNIFYRLNRLFDWKNKTGIQLENSLIVIGSSNLFGHGLKNTPLYFPESTTDFIFTSFVSNFGLIGSIILLITIIYFDLTLINIAIKSKNKQDKYITSSIVSIILFQQLYNIAMTIGLLPIMGITLPFISYGGSSLLSYMIGIGIIINIKSNKTIN